MRMRALDAADGARRPAVVHVAPDPQGRGGMAAVVRGLLASPLAERYELESITTHRTGSAPLRLGLALSGYIRLLAWCIRNPDGLVHVHAAVRGSIHRKAIAILVARALRRPVLVQIHAGPGDIDDFLARLRPAGRGFLRAALARAQSVVSVSEASSGAVAAAFGLRAVGVIANAAPEGPDTVEPPPADVALYLGGFEDPAKGGLDLAAALTGLGGGRVSWCGWLDADAKARALAEAGIVLLPSRSEGLPVVLLEAMAHGRAVVATRVGGIPEVLRDEIDGVLVDPGDADALVRATAQLSRDPKKLARLAGAARGHVAQLSEARIVERLDVTYRSLLGRR
jgi:glycosyltransferase involved in cell wall biosynthesis